MKLTDIKKLVISKEKYEFLMNCNSQFGAEYKFYIHNETYFNITKLPPENLLDFINSLSTAQIVKKPTYSITLRSPYWSAWQKYGWEKGIPGYGVKDTLCDAVVKDQTSLLVKYKGQAYRIGWKKLLAVARDHNYYFQVNTKTRLLIIPKYEFRKVEKRKKNEKKN